MGVTGTRLGYELCVVRCILGKFEVGAEILDDILDVAVDDDLSLAGYCLMLVDRRVVVGRESISGDGGRAGR
jgi:hypothetical protein